MHHIRKQINFFTTNKCGSVIQVTLGLTIYIIDDVLKRLNVTATYGCGENLLKSNKVTTQNRIGYRIVKYDKL